MPILIFLLIVGVTVFGNPTDNRVVYLKDASEETRIVENVALPFLHEKLLYDREAEQEIFSMVNVERKKAGLEDLVWDEEMAEVARAHSLDMWQRQYFAHENPDGETPLDRLLEDEIMLEKAGENLAPRPHIPPPGKLPRERTKDSWTLRAIGGTFLSQILVALASALSTVANTARW